MTRARPALRMVLDSSVAIFEVLKPNRLCYEWERSAFIPLISARTARELNRKLTDLAPKAAIADGQRVALEGAIWRTAKGSSFRIHRRSFPKIRRLRMFRLSNWPLRRRRMRWCPKMTGYCASISLSSANTGLSYPC